MTDDSQATLLAAIIAAVLSGVTLIVTGLLEVARRRWSQQDETVKWLRETLHQSALAYLQAGFTISGRSSDIHRRRLEGGATSDEIQLLRLELRAAHSVMRDQLTTIRLLAPASLIEAAELVHDTHHDVMNYVLDPDMTLGDTVTYDHVKETGRAARKTFIDKAREPVGLDPTPGEIGARAYTNFEAP